MKDRPEKEQRKKEALQRMWTLAIGVLLFISVGLYLSIALISLNMNILEWHWFSRVFYSVITLSIFLGAFGFVVDNYYHVKRYGRLKDKYEV